MLLVPAGRLGDARSRRTVFLVGVALFTASSAAAGAAPNPTLLAVARVVQGLAGSLISPQISGFIQNLFRGPERARAFGLFGATLGISTAIGPLLGGLLVQLGGPDLGWRLVFYVNVPIGAVLIVLALRLLPRSAPTRTAAVAGPGRGGAVRRGDAVRPAAAGRGCPGGPGSTQPRWPTGRGGCSAWPPPCWSASTLGAVLELAGIGRPWSTCALLKVRSYRLRPVPRRLSTSPGFTTIFLVMTLYLQVGLGYSALEAGATQTAVLGRLGRRRDPRRPADQPARAAPWWSAACCW